MKYVADDGTSFDTEKECVEYEKKLAKKYVVHYNCKDTIFCDETSARRFIADRLHDCYNCCNDGIVRSFKFEHCGKIVEFDSDEIAEFVPAHYKISSEKFDKIFQQFYKKTEEIPGYTLHGDYYLADKVIPNKTWKEACEMKEVITLPNGKKVVARTLSKEELKTIPRKERKIDENEHWWYWTSTPYSGNYAWYVSGNGGFYGISFTYSNGNGGARLGFKNPFIES